MNTTEAVSPPSLQQPQDYRTYYINADNNQLDAGSGGSSSNQREQSINTKSPFTATNLHDVRNHLGGSPENYHDHEDHQDEHDHEDGDEDDDDVDEEEGDYEGEDDEAYSHHHQQPHSHSHQNVDAGEGEDSQYSLSEFSHIRLVDGGGGGGSGGIGQISFHHYQGHHANQQQALQPPSSANHSSSTSSANRKRAFSFAASSSLSYGNANNLCQSTATGAISTGGVGTGEKRAATKICRVCGDKAYSYNFNVITCESCKAFFRRNANKDKEIRCPFNEQCDINIVSRRFCQRCRLHKCFRVGMKKEWIMSDEARLEKKQRIQDNRQRRLAERRIASGSAEELRTHHHHQSNNSNSQHQHLQDEQISLSTTQLGGNPLPSSSAVAAAAAATLMQVLSGEPVMGGGAEMVVGGGPSGSNVAIGDGSLMMMPLASAPNSMEVTNNVQLSCPSANATAVSALPAVPPSAPIPTSAMFSGVNMTDLSTNHQQAQQQSQFSTAQQMVAAAVSAQVAAVNAQLMDHHHQQIMPPPTVESSVEPTIGGGTAATTTAASTAAAASAFCSSLFPSVLPSGIPSLAGALGSGASGADSLLSPGHNVVQEELKKGYEKLVPLDSAFLMNNANNNGNNLNLTSPPMINQNSSTCSNMLPSTTTEATMNNRFNMVQQVQQAQALVVAAAQLEQHHHQQQQQATAEAAVAAHLQQQVTEIVAHQQQQAVAAAQLQQHQLAVVAAAAAVAAAAVPFPLAQSQGEMTASGATINNSSTTVGGSLPPSPPSAAVSVSQEMIAVPKDVLIKLVEQKIESDQLQQQQMEQMEQMKQQQQQQQQQHQVMTDLLENSSKQYETTSTDPISTCSHHQDGHQQQRRRSSTIRQPCSLLPQEPQIPQMITTPSFNPQPPQQQNLVELMDTNATDDGAVETRPTNDYGPLGLTDQENLNELIEANRVWNSEPGETQYGVTENGLRRLIKMCSQIGAFRALDRHDQTLMLRHGCESYFIIRAATSFNETKAPFLLQNGLSESVISFYKDFPVQWRTNETVNLVLGAILLFDPDLPDIHNRPSFSMENLKYQSLLKRILFTLCSTTGGNECATPTACSDMFAELMARVVRLKAASTLCSSDNFEPIVQQIFEPTPIVQQIV